MRTLYFIRHAKSSWEDPLLSDFDRPLNPRGERDAPRMGKRLKEKGIHPDLMISSPAARAVATGKIIAGAIGYQQRNIQTDQDLYHANEDGLLSTIRNLNDKNDEVILIGHNPGLTDCVNSLRGDQRVIDNIPTCGVVAITFAVASWADVDWGKGDVAFIDYPKSTEE